MTVYLENGNDGPSPPFMAALFLGKGEKIDFHFIILTIVSYICRIDAMGRIKDLPDPFIQ
jgi:hypothetical protein